MYQRGWLALCIALCSSGISAGAEFFTIRSSISRPLEVRYFLTGPFGGYGGCLSGPEKEDTYRIPLEQDEKPAKDLKAFRLAAGGILILFGVVPTLFQQTAEGVRNFISTVSSPISNLPHPYQQIQTPRFWLLGFGITLIVLSVLGYTT